MMGIYLLFATSPRTTLCLKVFLGDVLTIRKINPPCGFWLLRFGKVCKHTLLSP